MKKAILTVTVLTCLGHMLFAMANNAQGVLLTSFINAFGLASGSQGFPNAAANVAVLASMLLSVPVAARVGKQRLFVAGLWLMGLMLVLAGASPAAALLVLAYLVMGFGFGCIDTCASAIVADLHQGSRAAMMMGVLHAVYGAGGILAPILMTAALSGGVSWRWVLWALAIVVAIVAVLCAAVFTKHRDVLARGSRPPQMPTRSDVPALLKRPGNVALIFSTMCYCAHQCSIYLWIQRIIGVGLGNVGLGAAALSLFWVGTVASRLLVPALRMPVVRYLRYGMLLTTLLLLGGVLLGGATIPMALSEITRRNPERSMLAITAVLLTTAVAAIVCAPLIGFIVGKTALIAGLVVSDVFALGCALCAFGVKEEKFA